MNEENEFLVADTNFQVCTILGSKNQWFFTEEVGPQEQICRRSPRMHVDANDVRKVIAGKVAKAV